VQWRLLASLQVVHLACFVCDLSRPHLDELLSLLGEDLRVTGEHVGDVVLTLIQVLFMGVDPRAGSLRLENAVLI